MFENGIGSNNLRPNYIASSSTVAPSSGRKTRDVYAPLTLTSLVDAFTVIVLYLLLHSGLDQQVNLDMNGITLPEASQTSPLLPSPTVRIVSGRYFLDDEIIEISALAGQLEIAKKKAPDSHSLIIQADKAADFRDINPILIAGSKTGFNQFRFAVIQGSENP